MANRCTLHISKLAKFVDYLDSQNIMHRPGKGDYQILQVQTRIGWQCIYKKLDAKEHYTVQDGLLPIIRNFIKISK